MKYFYYCYYDDDDVPSYCIFIKSRAHEYRINNKLCTRRYVIMYTECTVIVCRRRRRLWIIITMIAGYNNYIGWARARRIKMRLRPNPATMTFSEIFRFRGRGDKKKDLTGAGREEVTLGEKTVGLLTYPADVTVSPSWFSVRVNTCPL